MDDKTQLELASGLKKWVAEYIVLRHNKLIHGNVEVKMNIDKEIKEKGLNKDEVYGCFGGDPDNPETRKEIMGCAELFIKMNGIKKEGDKNV